VTDAQPGGASGIRAADVVKVALGILIGAAGLALTLFQLHDRIWPPVTVQGGEVVAADLVAANVTYENYVNHHRLWFPHPDQAVAHAGPLANDPGVVVDVVLRMQGLRGRECHVIYRVYRTPLALAIGPRKALTKCTARVQDGDEGGWAAWVPLPTPPPDAAGKPVTHHYFIRFDLLDEHGQLLGPGKTTKVFGWNGLKLS
jgi:hypothetical protein